MKKALLAIAFFGLTIGVSSCATISDDEAADLVGMSLQASSVATGGGGFGTYKDMAVSPQSDKSTFAQTVVTNSDGSVTTSINFITYQISVTYREPTFSDNYVNQIFGFYMGTALTNFGISSEMNFRFLDSSQLQINLNSTNDFASLDVLSNGGGVQIYGAVALDATNGSSIYHLGGTFGNSKSDPFMVFYAAGTGLVDGTITFTAVTPDVDNVAILIDFDHLSMSTNNYEIFYDKIVFYPDGDVTGYVKAGSRTIDYTLQCDGTANATLLIGSKSYNVNWVSGEVTPNS